MPFKNYFFVGVQLLLFLAFFLEIDNLKFNRLEMFQPVFLVLSGLGFLLILLSLWQLRSSLSPFPKPREDGSLITSGLYKYVRHPVYTAILIFFFFLALYFGSGYKVGIVFLLMLLFWFKSQYEEKQLCQKYPAYNEYRKLTGRFLPKFKWEIKKESD